MQIARYLLFFALGTARWWEEIFQSCPGSGLIVYSASLLDDDDDDDGTELRGEGRGVPEKGARGAFEDYFKPWRWAVFLFFFKLFSDNFFVDAGFEYGNFWNVQYFWEKFMIRMQYV